MKKPKNGKQPFVNRKPLQIRNSFIHPDMQKDWILDKGDKKHMVIIQGVEILPLGSFQIIKELEEELKNWHEEYAQSSEKMIARIKELEEQLTNEPLT